MNRTTKLWHLQSSGIDGNSGFYKFTVCDEDGREIVNVRQSVLGTTYTELEANARLIAAAPELLEACQAALNHVCGMQVRDIVASAITRALGQELKAPAISENLNQPL